jgi:hypothetical protein
MANTIGAFTLKPPFNINNSAFELTEPSGDDEVDGEIKKYYKNAFYTNFDQIKATDDYRKFWIEKVFPKLSEYDREILKKFICLEFAYYLCAKDIQDILDKLKLQGQQYQSASSEISSYKSIFPQPQDLDDFIGAEPTRPDVILWKMLITALDEIYKLNKHHKSSGSDSEQKKLDGNVIKYERNYSLIGAKKDIVYKQLSEAIEAFKTGSWGIGNIMFNDPKIIDRLKLLKNNRYSDNSTVKKKLEDAITGKSSRIEDTQTLSERKDLLLDSLSSGASSAASGFADVATGTASGIKGLATSANKSFYDNVLGTKGKALYDSAAETRKKYNPFSYAYNRMFSSKAKGGRYRKNRGTRHHGNPLKHHRTKHRQRHHKSRRHR